MEPTLIEILKTEYGFEDEDIQNLIAAGVLQGDLATVEREKNYYEDLTRTPTPKARGFGRIYKAAHPLEFLGAAGKSIVGQYGRWREEQKRQGIQEDLAELRDLFLRGGGGRRSPATPPTYDPDVIVGGPR